MVQPPANLRLRRARGFTLIELMVAISVLALVAVLSWRGLDGMVRAQEQTRARADEVLALQAGLAQWTADLDAVIELPQAQAIDWDGRGLRLVRRAQIGAAETVEVVAWTRRNNDEGGVWLRWQSPPLSTRGALVEAWNQAAQWAQNPGEQERRREVSVAALAQWQIFYFRGDAWTNPLSSDGSSPAPAAPPVGPALPQSTLPDGVRLVLTLPPGTALSGTLVRDWVRPTLTGSRS